MELVGPVALEPGNAFPDWARVGVELGRGGGEEAAAGEDAPLEVREEPSQSKSNLLDVVGGRRWGTTHASKIAPAVSIVASWSSSLEPKWA